MGVRLPVPVAEFAKRFAARTLRAGDISRFFDIERRTQAVVPFAASAAVCGFPSAADDYMEPSLDFNEYMIDNQAATFVVRVKGDSMIGAGMMRHPIPGEG